MRECWQLFGAVEHPKLCGLQASFALQQQVTMTYHALNRKGNRCFQSQQGIFSSKYGSVSYRSDLQCEFGMVLKDTCCTNIGKKTHVFTEPSVFFGSLDSHHSPGRTVQVTTETGAERTVSEGALEICQRSKCSENWVKLVLVLVVFLVSLYSDGMKCFFVFFCLCCYILVYWIVYFIGWQINSQITNLWYVFIFCKTHAENCGMAAM